MNWLDKLERKFGRVAIPGLINYIVLLNAVIFILMRFSPASAHNITNKFILVPELVLKGQVWRLITYIFIPPTNSLLWIIIALYFYYMIGNALEQEWGSFRFNLYYFMGMLGTTIAAFVSGIPVSATYINLSLFLAFARLYPDFEILIYFIIPVKMKYIAWFNWLFIGYSIVVLPIPYKLAPIASIINYFIFFGKDIINRTNTSRKSYHTRQKFKASMPTKATIHKCTTCGITEKDNPDMDFRYCSKCNGDYEYCMDHLKSHDHVQ